MAQAAPGAITVNGDPFPWHEGLTVAAIIQRLNFKFPLLVVKIDGRLVPRSEFASEVVPAGAAVIVLHLMSGG